MSHPNPSYDPENSYPDDPYNQEESIPKKKKKVNMAKKMFKVHGSVMDTMMKSLRKKPHPFFKKGPGGSGDLPPGRRDRDNE